MNEGNQISEEKTDIRMQAEEVLKEKNTDTKKLSSYDIQSLVHEFQVHQIELEMQNEELRRTQQELENARTRYRDLYDFAPLGYFTFDKGGSILEVNLTGAKKLGIERGKLIKKSFHLYIAPDFKDVFYLHLRHVFNTQTQMTCELRLVDNNGNQFDVLLESLPVSDIDGNIICRTAISDITKRKRTEEALRESEEIFRYFMEYSPIYVFFKDENIRSLRLSKNYESMLGKPLKELLGKSMYDLFPSELANSMVADDMRILKEGKEITVEEEFNGRLYSTTKFPIFIDGKPLYLAGYTIDISERKKNEEIHIENERLIAVNKSKAEFLAVMGHELRTPLTPIIGYMLLLKEQKHGVLNEKQKYYVNVVLKRSKYLLDIINSILDLGKIEAGKLKLVIEDVSVPEIINEILDMAEDEIALKNMIVKKYFDPDLDIIKADRLKVKQILYNILNNAIKYTDRQGDIITVTTKKDGNFAKISISDTGIGIKKKDIPKLFRKFEQLDQGPSRKYGGSGLGLAITKQLVELHGGKIMAQSEYNKGTTITFLLPIDRKMVV